MRKNALTVVLIVLALTLCITTLFISVYNAFLPNTVKDITSKADENRAISNDKINGLEQKIKNIEEENSKLLAEIEAIENNNTELINAIFDSDGALYYDDIVGFMNGLPGEMLETKGTVYQWNLGDKYLFVAFEELENGLTVKQIASYKDPYKYYLKNVVFREMLKKGEELYIADIVEYFGGLSGDAANPEMSVITPWKWTFEDGGICMAVFEPLSKKVIYILTESEEQDWEERIG